MANNKEFKVKNGLISAGNIGINKTAPNYKLHIVESTTNAGALFIEDGTSWLRFVPSLGGGGFNPISTAGNIGIVFSTDNDSSTDTSSGLVIAPHSNNIGGIKITETGKVGIGHAAPARELHVNGTVEINGSIFFDGSTTSNHTISHGTGTTQPSISFWGEDHASYPGQVHIIGRSDNSSSSAGEISFWDYTGSGWNRNMVIKKDGKVGIGTDSPDTTLDVTSSGVHGVIMNQDLGNTSVSGRIFFKDSTRTNTILNVSGNLEFRTGASIGSTSGDIRLTVQGDGKVKIGTGATAYRFPTADGSSGQVLQTDGSGNLTFAAAGGGTITGVSNMANNRILTAQGATTINAESGLLFGHTTDGQRLDISLGGQSGSATGTGYIGNQSSIVGGNSNDFVLAGSNRLVLGSLGNGRVYIDGSTINVSGNLQVNGTQVISSARLIENVTLDNGTAGARRQVDAWHYDAGNNRRFYFDDAGAGNTYYGLNKTSAGHIFRNGSDQGKFTISETGGINIAGGDTKVTGTTAIAYNGTTVLDTSRNLTNIGTISSGAITSTGAISAEDNIYLTDAGTIRGKLLLNASDRDNVELRAESLGSTMKFFTVGTQALLLDASQNATFAGKVTINEGDVADQLVIYRTSPSANQVGMKFDVHGVHSRFFGVGTDGHPYWSTTANLTGAGNGVWHSGLSNFKVGTVSVLTSSRNLQNIGTYSGSGTLTITKNQVTSNFATTPAIRVHPASVSSSGGRSALFLGTSTIDNYGISLRGARLGTDGNPTFEVAVHQNSGDGLVALSIDTNRNASFSHNVQMGSGNATGKFAVMSTGVHASYDFYNNGTSYFNGATTVDDALDLTGSNRALKIAGTTVIDSSRNLTNIGTISSGSITVGAGTNYVGLAISGSNSSYTAATIGNTGSGDAILYFDASNGDFAGSDYASIKQNNALDMVLRTEANAHGISFQTKGNQRFRISGGGTLEIGSSNTAILDQSRNLSNIGTISSGVLSVNGGTTNVVATFQSTDGIAGIKLQDSSGNVELSASGSTFRIQPSGGTPVLEVDSTGRLTVTTGQTWKVNTYTVDQTVNTTGGWARSYRCFNENSTADEETVFFGVHGGATGISKAYWTVGDPTSIDVTGYNTNNGVFLKANGYFGVNTNTPTTPLDVHGMVRVQESSNTAFYSGNYVRVFDDQNYGFRNSGGATIARISMNGKSYFNGGFVGIGTTNPIDLLHIKSTTTDARQVIDGHTGYDAEVKFAENGSVKYTIGHDAASDNFVIGTTNVDTQQRLVINSSGNVGIGTTLPTVKLEIQENTNSADVKLRLRSFNSSAAGRSTYIAYDPDTRIMGFGEGGDELNIDQNGKVGIGTSSPSLKLHSKDTGNYQLDLDSGGTRWRMGAGWSGYYQNSFLLADTANGLRMVIDTSGRVGIGVASPGGKLEIKSSGSTANEINLIHSGNTAKIVSLGQESSHGSLVLRNNSGVNQVRLSAGGNSSYFLNTNIGIGTTSPTTALHIDQTGNTRNDGLFIERNGSTYGLNLYVDSGGYGVIGGNGGFTPDIMKLDFNQEYVGIGTIPAAKLHIVNNSTSSDALLLESTEASSSAAPILTFKRHSSSPADADYLGQLKFKGENDADQDIVYAKITAKIDDASDGTEDGLIEFMNKKAGSNVITARLKSDKLQLLNSTSLEVAGDVVAFASSDARLKDNVTVIDSALNKVKQIRGVEFDWNDKQNTHKGHDIGVIAQEVEQVVPELVRERDDGYKAVDYPKLTAVLIEAVKELELKVKELEEKLK